MNTEVLKESIDNGGLTVESLKVMATISNMTEDNMILKNASLDWGKWIEKPKNIEGEELGNFSCSGKAYTPSGTEGFITWNIGSSTITLKFAAPYTSQNYASIECDTNKYIVSCKGTGGDINQVTAKIKKK